MNFVDRLKWRRAAKAYARRLGSELAKAYGGLPPYTTEQVATAARRLGLDTRWIALGYAPFVAEADYHGIISQLPKPLPRETALEFFERYRPFRPATGDRIEPAPPAIGA